jgi:cell division protein ZapA
MPPVGELTGPLFHGKPKDHIAPKALIADNGARVSGARTVKIEIFDQSYNVQADGNEEYLTELAEYVDSRMREVAEATRMADSLKVAVLAALNIADEMFRTREKNARLEGPTRERVEKCLGMVDRALEHTH